MHYEFTPAVERALRAAARWRSRPNGDDLYGPELLLGLLAEPECRSALLLARHGIDAAAVERRWPALSAVEPDASRPLQFSSEVLAALAEAESRLFEYPQPLTLATEHVLLGLVGAPSEVALWLREQGLEPAALELEVHRLAGHQPGPLAWDEAEPGGHAELSGATRPRSDELPDEDALGEPLDIPADLGPPPTAPPGRSPSATSPGPDRTAAWRILDAAANRAAEGLRVVEDYVRFSLDDGHLTSLAKELRHDLAAALGALPVALRHAARETQADVGTQVTHAGEFSRSSPAEVALASCKRAQQALRSLEEYAKTIDVHVAAACEQIRYRSYTLERAVGITQTSLERLAERQLYVLIDGRGGKERFTSLVDQLVAARVDVLQLRDKQSSDRELLELARLLVHRTRGTDTLAIVNDRPDIALLSRADGVHVGQDELPVKEARSIVGPAALVGVSTHSLSQARAAVLDGADYLGVGPTFSSTTKQFAEIPGLALVDAVSREIRLPSFVIGGITLDNLPQVLAHGATRVAVSGAILSAADPAAAARAFKAVLAAAQPAR